MNITEVGDMDIKATGVDYFSNVRESLMRSANNNSKKESSGFMNNTFLNDVVNLNKTQEDRLIGLRKVKALLDDLKNTELIKNNNSLSQFSVDFIRNDAGIKVEIDDAELLKKETLTINVKKLAQSAAISSDDISDSKNVGFTGIIEINGVQINIKKEDTKNILINKLNFGEDVNNNNRIDSGEDLDNDRKLTDKTSMKTNSYYSEGRLVIESKELGEKSYVNVEGSSPIIGEKLGLVDGEGNLKNVLTSGEDGEIEVNGNKITLSENEISINGIKIDLSKAIEGEDSIVEIRYNEDRVISKLQEFQEKYNKLLDYLNNFIKSENKDIKEIKNKIYIQSNRDAGIDVKKGNFYDVLLSIKDGIGNVINKNLKSGGVVSDNDGKVQLDFSKIKNNIDNIRENFKAENNDTIFSNIGKEIAPYFEKVNTLDIKQEAVIKSLEELNSKYEKKSKIEEIQEDNKKINAKIRELAHQLNIDTHIAFGSHRKEKLEKEKAEKDKSTKVKA